MKLTIKNILIFVGVVIVDVLIGFCLAFLLINVDDRGNWTFELMSNFEKTVFVGYVAWGVVNFIFIAYLIGRFVKKNTLFKINFNLSFLRRQESKAH